MPASARRSAAGGESRKWSRRSPASRGQRLTLVVPECVDALAGILCAQRVGPASADEALEGGAAFRLHQRVVGVGFRRIDVELGRRDIVVTDEHDRRACLSQRSGVEAQPLVPGELVVEFRAGLRVAVGRIDAGDEDAVDGGLDVAGLDVGSVARQGGAGEDRLDTASDDGDAVPGASGPARRHGSRHGRGRLPGSFAGRPSTPEGMRRRAYARRATREGSTAGG